MSCSRYRTGWLRGSLPDTTLSKYCSTPSMWRCRPLRESCWVPICWDRVPTVLSWMSLYRHWSDHVQPRPQHVPQQVLHAHFLRLFCSYFCSHVFKGLGGGRAVLSITMVTVSRNTRSRRGQPPQRSTHQSVASGLWAWHRSPQISNNNDVRARPLDDTYRVATVLSNQLVNVHVVLVQLGSRVVPTDDAFACYKETS